MEQNATSVTPALPPIVLMVDDDAEALQEYSSVFESSGMWVATATQPSEAMDAVDELRPNLIVTDFGLNVTSAAEFVHTLKSTPTTHDIAVIVLTAPAPAPGVTGEARREADLCLTKPVAPATLLVRAQQLLDKTQSLRERIGTVRQRTAELLARSRKLRETTAALSATMARQRACPGCGGGLEWIERGRIGGTTYDYYRWCLKGCGLYCFDRDGQRWVRLA